MTNSKANSPSSSQGRVIQTAVVLSGGMDSATLLYDLVHDGHQCTALLFNYSQRHACELGYATRLCAHQKVPYQLVDLTDVSHLFAGSSSQVNKAVAVPDGHYTEDAMKVTVVPNRNMIMLSLAVGYAVAHGMDNVAYGAHKGDHAIYPDCRASFVEAMQHAIGLCDWHPIKLLAPYLKLTKAEICKRGAELGVPFADTWSCYNGDGKTHCGKCATCIERLESFLLAGVPDPTNYAPMGQAYARKVLQDHCDAQAKQP